MWAQGSLARCYYFGDGVAEDAQEAAKWRRKSAEQGNVDAQFLLGACYANGKGVAKDKSESVKWFRKAIEQGDGRAQWVIKMLELEE